MSSLFYPVRLPPLKNPTFNFTLDAFWYSKGYIGGTCQDQRPQYPLLYLFAHQSRQHTTHHLYDLGAPHCTHLAPLSSNSSGKPPRLEKQLQCNHCWHPPCLDINLFHRIIALHQGKTTRDSWSKRGVSFSILFCFPFSIFTDLAGVIANLSGAMVKYAST